MHARGEFDVLFNSIHYNLIHTTPNLKQQFEKLFVPFMFVKLDKYLYFGL